MVRVLFFLLSFSSLFASEKLMERLQLEGKETILLFSYGSLLDEDSAKMTLSNQVVSDRKLALAFGCKRLFNRDVPIRVGSFYGEPVSPKARGMLNLLPTQNPYDIINGVIFTLPLSELPALCRREEGYELIPIECVLWQESIEKKRADRFIAYTFSAKTPGPYTSSDILPRPGYYELVRDAAEREGLLYYYLWMNTTYMADGKDLIIDWELAVEEGRDETLIFYNENRIPQL